MPALDPAELATVSARVTTGLLRGELGFTGTVVTDALEMRALADTVGMVEGFVQALIAGADAIETGAQDYPELVDAIPGAVARAVADGRLRRDRLEDAARRTAQLASRAGRRSWPARRTTRSPRAASRSSDHCPSCADRWSSSAARPGGMASGELPWSLGEPLAQLVPGTEVVRTTETDRPRRRSRRSCSSCAIRSARQWQLPMIAACRTVVVVDCGWPRRSAACPVVRTRGIAPPLLRAAAHTLVVRRRSR